MQKDLISKHLGKLATFSHRHYVSVLLVALLLTGLSVAAVTQLKIKTGIGDLLPEHTHSRAVLNSVMERVGATGYLIAFVEGNDPEEMKRWARAMSDELYADKEQRIQQGQEEFVLAVDYRNEIDYFSDHALYFISPEDLQEAHDRIKDTIRREKLKANPFFVSLDDEEEEEKDNSDGEDPKESFEFKSLHEKYRTGDFKEYFIADDKSVLAILVKATTPSSNIGFARRINAYIRGVSAKVMKAENIKGLHFDIGGGYRNKIAEQESIYSDLTTTALVTLLALILLLVVYFRRLRAILFVMTPLTMGVLWALAAAWLKYGYLNLITAFITAILLGLGIDFGIHYLSRYLEERRIRNNGILDSLVITQQRTGRAVFTGGITTAAAFAVLMVADFRGFSQFGFIAAIGVVSTLLASFTVLPALITLTETLSPMKPRRIDKASLVAPMKQLRHPGTIVIVSGLAVLYCLYVVGQSAASTVPDNAWHSDEQRCDPADLSCEDPLLSFEYDFRKLRARNEKIYRLSKKYGKAMPLTLQPVLLLADNMDEAKQAQQKLTTLMDEKGNAATIKAVRSIYTFLPDDMEAKKQQIRDIGGLLLDKDIDVLKGEAKEKALELRDRAKADPVRLFALPEKILRMFSVVRPGNEDVLPALKTMLHDEPLTDLGPDFAAAVQKHIGRLSAKTKLHLARAFNGATAMPDAELTQHLTGWARNNFGVQVMIYNNIETWNGIACMRFTDQIDKVVLDNGKTYYPAGEPYIFSDTLRTMEADSNVVVVLALLMVLVLLWIDFRRLRYALLALLPLVVGVLFMVGFMAATGIRFSFFNIIVLPLIIGIGVDSGVHVLRRYLENHNIEEVMNTTGMAVVMAALTTVVGFASLILANHQGLNSIGELAVIGVFACLASATIAFPAVLKLYDRYREK